MDEQGLFAMVIALAALDRGEIDACLRHRLEVDAAVVEEAAADLGRHLGRGPSSR